MRRGGLTKGVLMSLNRKSELYTIARELCRNLRKDSTEAERILWQAVRNKKFYGIKFYRQFPLFFDYYGKESFFIADYYSYQIKTVVEIDGGYHKRQNNYDRLRTVVINDLGIKVLRYRNEQIISNISYVLKDLQNNIKKPLSSQERGLG